MTRHANVHPIFRPTLLVYSEPLMREVPVAAHDLQPGDDLVTTGLGGHSGRIYSVQLVEPLRVRVVFEEPGQSCYLGWWEFCTVRRGPAGDEE